MIFRLDLKGEKKESSLDIHLGVFNGDNTFYFERWLKSIDSGIILTNEGSMIDADRVDSFEGGLVGRQSVNLENKTGNPAILNLYEFMLSKEKCIIFPGTLLRDFGGYVLQTMPIINEGKLLFEKVKQTGIPYVDNPRLLPESLLGGKLEDKINIQKQNSLASVEFEGLRILPLICNELFTVPGLYSGEPVDIIVHSSNNLMKSCEKAEEVYKKVLKQFGDAGKIKEPLTLACCELNEDEPYSALFIYKNNILSRLR